MLAVATPPPVVRRSVISPRKPKQFSAPAPKKSKSRPGFFWKREKCDLNSSTVSECLHDDASFEPYEATFINKQAAAVAAALMDSTMRRRSVLRDFKSAVGSPLSGKRHLNNNSVDKLVEKTLRSASLTPKQSERCTLVKGNTNTSTYSLCTLRDIERERRPGHRFAVFSRKWKHRVSKKRIHSKRGATENHGNSKQNDKNMKLVMDTTLQIVLRHPEYSQSFRLFLKGEYSDENYEFWTNVDHFRQNSTLELQKNIYDTFIKNGSPQEVNISFDTKVWTKTQILDLNPHCFDRAQKDIYQLMEKDSFPRFILSVTC